MLLILEIMNGPEAGRTVSREAGRLCHVGRSTWADFPVGADRAVSDLHFLVEAVADGGFVRDLGSRNGTFLNGERIVGRVAIRDGDVILAGITEFRVRFANQSVSLDAAHRELDPEVSQDSLDSGLATAMEKLSHDESWRTRLREILSRGPGTLYAVLDAARTPEIPALLSTSNHTYQSLYEGVEGDLLAMVAPYLIELPSGSKILDVLIERGWGRSWGIYLASDRPFAWVRKHLRHFLKVELQGGKRVYFRFYDPRVLREYLPTCHPNEAQEFLGPIQRVWAESPELDALLVWTVHSEGIRHEKSTLTLTAMTSNVEAEISRIAKT